MNTIRERLHAIGTQLKGTFVQRDKAIDCMMLAAISGDNFILVGDPGTAKTAVAKAFYAHVSGARAFTMLCGSFQTEDKTFGPVDLEGLKLGHWRRVIRNRLADCELAFLDEILKANDGTLNGMLTALNERTYDGQPIPLRMCGAATNWPEVNGRSEHVAALWDRFLLRCDVQEVQGDDARLQLLEAIDKVASYKPETTVSMEELEQVRVEFLQVEVPKKVRRTLVSLDKKLRDAKVEVSARRLGRLQNVMRAAAWLAGRSEVKMDDFDVLEFGLWHDRQQIKTAKQLVAAIDEEVVNKAIAALRDAAAQCKGGVGISKDRAPQLVQMIGEAIELAHQLRAEFGMRESSEARIKAEFDALRQTYDKIRAMVDSAVEPAKKGKKKDANGDQTE